MKQFWLYSNGEWPRKKRYSNVITVSKNRKGVIDIDTVKGCTSGMRAYPNGGCYGECYAYKNAVQYNFDFTVSVSRQFMGREHKGTLIKLMITYPVGWYRIGTAGDPCHDWKHTVAICNALWHIHKVPVIITKHWEILEDWQIEKLRHLKAVINTSVSGMDTDGELKHRMGQRERLRSMGIKSVLRIVTCKFGTSEWARTCQEKQEYLLSCLPIIDNPLRARISNPRVINGDIIITRRDESVGGGKYVSLNCPTAYLGTCGDCPDQCGVDNTTSLNMDKEYQYEDETTGALFA